jgi:hypothetical protein
VLVTRRGALKILLLDIEMPGGRWRTIRPERYDLAVRIVLRRGRQGRDDDAMAIARVVDGDGR